MKSKQSVENHYGRILKRIELNQFVLTEKLFISNTVLPKHSHTNAYFTLVLQGTFNEQHKAGNRFCQAASVVFRPSGETHSDQFGKNGGKCFHFQPKDDWLAQIRDYPLILDTPMEFQGGKMAQLFGRLYHELCYFDAVSNLAIQSLSLEIAVTSFREQKTSISRQVPKWLKRAKELLNDRILEQLDLNLIAKSVGVHPVHLARSFRSYYGCSVGEYLRSIKIKYSSDILTSSKKPISEIAYEFGFSSQSHFTTAFKRSTGLTPTEYRKIFRKC